MFQTQSLDRVNEFAREWGFFETPYHTEGSVEKVREFSDAVKEDGAWKGEPIEGFVVRCYVKDSLDSNDPDVPPYPPGSSFFFKIKFDEPYLMYRDWREITKIILNKKAPPLSKLKRVESRLYSNWVCGEIKRVPQQFRDYNKGKGIIAVRDRFLDWLKSEEGQDRKLEESTKGLSISQRPHQSFNKTVIVPIAVPGCGKTTVAVALSKLFGFIHIQSDDIQGKKSLSEKLAEEVKKALQKHDVVIADM